MQDFHNEKKDHEEKKDETKTEEVSGECSECNECHMKTPSAMDKWRFTFYTVIAFILVIAPFTYGITNALLGGFIGKLVSKGCPTMMGLAVHTVVFTLLVRYMMELDI